MGTGTEEGGEEDEACDALVQGSSVELRIDDNTSSGSTGPSEFDLPAVGDVLSGAANSTALGRRLACVANGITRALTLCRPRRPNTQERPQRCAPRGARVYFRRMPRSRVPKLAKGDSYGTLLWLHLA